MPVPFQITFNDIFDSSLLPIKDVFTESNNSDDNEANQTVAFFNELAAEAQFKSEELPENTKKTLLLATINATINKYRMIQKITPMNFSGAAAKAAAWRQTHGESIYDFLSRRPHSSANLGGVDQSWRSSTLFLEKTLTLSEPIGHITEYRPQSNKLPDYTKSDRIWQASDLQIPINFPAYAADLIASIAGTWPGKDFLTQTIKDGIFFGTDIHFNKESIAVTIATASKQPKTV